MSNYRHRGQVEGQLAITFTTADPSAPAPALTTREYLHHIATGGTYIRRPTIWSPPHLYDHTGQPIAPISLTDLVELEINGLISARHQVNYRFPTIITELGRQTLATLNAAAA